MSREKDAANYALISFAVLSVLLLLFPASRLAHTARIVASYSLYPSLHYGAKYAHFVRNVPSNIVSLLETDQENRTLRARNKELELQLQRAAVIEADNERLAAAMRLSRYLPWAGAWARVINKDPSDWYGSFFIDKGSDDGIAVNDTVLGLQGEKAGLAGRVFEVYPKFSKVLLLTNPSASAVCSIAPAGMEALVEGRGTWRLKMNYVPEESGLTEGAELVTAKGGILFPAGLPVGTVTKIYPRESSMNFITAEVQPLVNVNTLKEVYVVRRKLPREFSEQEGRPQ
ncbi:MAG: rod shape-determining protein MreC [Elusimicrobia bacterium]|nr:rod shape-determining protein MreC [Elusimicrobiota bacterium]